MEKRELTCIGCPMGCQITVTLEDGEAAYIMHADIIKLNGSIEISTPGLR